jgi:hypothetical protein
MKQIAFIKHILVQFVGCLSKKHYYLHVFNKAVKGYTSPLRPQIYKYINNLSPSCGWRHGECMAVMRVVRPNEN